MNKGSELVYVHTRDKLCWHTQQVFFTCFTNTDYAVQESGITYCLFQLRSLSPYIGNEDGVAVASNGVLEVVGQLGLAEGDVFPALVCQSNHHLLQE